MSASEQTSLPISTSNYRSASDNRDSSLSQAKATSITSTERQCTDDDQTDAASYRHIELDEGEEEDVDQFVLRYGSVNVKYIKRPKISVWFFNKPYALNFFYNGTLYRTKTERGESGKIELFLDLLYVGIVAKIASDATEDASWRSLLQYILLFLPIWQVWSDIKDFMNYYFNEDLSQKLYVLWILSLLVVYCNGTNFILESNYANAFVIVPYIFCRLSLSIALLIYSFYIPQHRQQIILYGCLILVTCALWIPVIFIPIKAKIILAFITFFLELASQAISYHPWTKKKLQLKYSTALNIEHEVERFGAFYVIAIGEFLYNIVTTGYDKNFGLGFSEHLGRAIMLLIISFIMLWLYFNGDGSFHAVHAVRRSATTAMLWLWLHMPLIASLILSADAAADLCYEDEVENKAVSYFFTGGLSVTLLMLYGIAILDKSKDDADDEAADCVVKKHYVSKFWRLLPRIPVAALFIVLSACDLSITQLFAGILSLLTALFVYELVMAGLHDDPEEEG